MGKRDNRRKHKEHLLNHQQAVAKAAPIRGMNALAGMLDDRQDIVSAPKKAKVRGRLSDAEQEQIALLRR